MRGETVTGTVGAPGTGLSYRQTLVNGSETVGSEPPRAKPRCLASRMALTVAGKRYASGVSQLI